MPSPSLPPKQEPRGRSFVVVALVAVALGGAFLVWKSSTSSVVERVESSPVATATPAQQAVEAPPPPPEEAPPVPEPIEVKPEPAKPGAPRRDTSCEDPCTGNETPELLSALRGKAGQARGCYERALSHNSSLSGSVVVNVRVSPTGTACSVSAGKDTLGDAAVSNCVLQRFKSGKFPKPKGGCVDVALPINFVPAQH